MARTGQTTTPARPIRPLRASGGHDSRVRRIATITPDIVRPKPHDFAPGAPQAAVRESKDNISNGTRRVRVQIVNANPDPKKATFPRLSRDETRFEPLKAFWRCECRSAPG